MLTRRIQFWDEAHKLAGLVALLSLLFSADSHAAGPPPAVSVQPLDQIVIKGGTVVLTVAATSSTALSYQWYFNGAALAGATATNYLCLHASFTNAGSYHVAVKNGGGTVNSRTAAVTVVYAPFRFESLRYNGLSSTCRLSGSSGIYLLSTSSDLKSWVTIHTNWCISGVMNYAGLPPSEVRQATDASPVERSGRFFRGEVSYYFSDYDLYILSTNGGQFLPSWTAQYNGTANDHDYLQATVVDPVGNVFATGYAKESASGTHDYVTVKYDSAGNRIWRAVYDGNAGRDDQACALALDAAGNVYVTGSSQLSSGAGGWDYVTVKYDASGNQLWANRYNGSANKDDLASAIAVDTNGNVVVTGKSKNASDKFQYATVKYNNAGNQLWLRTYVGSAASEDNATAVAVDATGNVYVTGKSKGTLTAFDYATIKYAPAGTQLWASRYSGDLLKDDNASKVVVDVAGNVYVTGDSEGLLGSVDYATVKYNSNGVQLWVATYNGPANKDDQPSNLALDSAGNVFVTGASGVTDTKADYATVKYSPQGQQLWVRRYDGPIQDDDNATALALDAVGDVYVTGQSKGNSTGYDFATVKYLNADGTQKWIARFNSGSGNNDAGMAVGVDRAGSVYVGGQAFNKLDYTLIKYLQPPP